jgi:hypothetical protein
VEDLVIDRVGHVYKLKAVDGEEEHLYLVIGKNALTNTAYGQLWDVVELEHGYIDDEWEENLANHAYYELVS